ncbi:TetR/AcrR family transcriptional regulator [Mameliella sediminis]|uniref:TetR/AcrR family transcriptional regulator n=1 Tax=Mameliella sediminis TaxID=2836866 RepID=UPI001C43977F|nr:TetR/AcrR family transcriptional regulator [Mameliella sediminis]MBV7393887.1 TetR/AcrR family transcriptional regulator [Mameliella sediminis]MBY6115833.1 TetR/AcrR family transcriptional regulator [Antarctobacter heliothermus]MBY6145389.1 TetR/AcrR family transcriptional regulator [Mameliella alba]MCA0955137.1 TetR/AcrR family transcriptional regulator [Mameliella alba]
MSETTDKPRHHHGNLRNALIEAGIDLLREGGLAALSLRKCAARAGVSHAAPAHHFEGVEGLRAAIAQEGFRRFETSMRRHADAGDQSPRGRLHGICRGYLAFARDEPALYDLIFSFRAGNPHVRHGDAAKSPAYRLLRETCAPFVPPGVDPVVVETQVWALVHGLAMLTLTGRFQDMTPPVDGVLSLLDRIGAPPMAS